MQFVRPWCQPDQLALDAFSNLARKVPDLLSVELVAATLKNAVGKGPFSYRCDRLG